MQDEQDDPKWLRAQAARWRKVAIGYDERTAKALTAAAQSLEDRAAAIEARRASSVKP
jgi:hypothetical protein